MTNWKLHVRGRYNTGKSHYLVEEIVGIDFDVNLPESVAFIHPDFVNNKQTDSKARSGSGGRGNKLTKSLKLMTNNPLLMKMKH